MLKKLMLIFVVCAMTFPVFGNDDVQNISIRDKKAVALSFNTGWNSLSGFGPMFSMYMPYLAIDGGTGFSMVGLKKALRGRLLFRPSKTVSPFLGLGFIHGGGLNAVESTPDAKAQTTLYIYDVKPSSYIQATLGFEVMTKGGFFFLMSSGYAHLLQEDNVNIIYGSPTVIEQAALETVHGGGFVFELSLGFAI